MSEPVVDEIEQVVEHEELVFGLVVEVEPLAVLEFVEEEAVVEI